MAVYFAQYVDGPVKIGFSDDPEKRVAQLEPWLDGKKLHLLATIPGGIATERGLHEQFAGNRIARGEVSSAASSTEWFWPTARLARLIAKAGGRILSDVYYENRPKRREQWKYVARGTYRLRVCARRRGLTDSDLALALGVAQPTISCWILGKSAPDQESRRRIEIWSDGFVVATDWPPNKRTKCRPTEKRPYAFPLDSAAAEAR